jgi:hypothetical protein
MRRRRGAGSSEGRFGNSLRKASGSRTDTPSTMGISSSNRHHVLSTRPAGVLLAEDGHVGFTMLKICETVRRREEHRRLCPQRGSDSFSSSELIASGYIRSARARSLHLVVLAHLVSPSNVPGYVFKPRGPN